MRLADHGFRLHRASYETFFADKPGNWEKTHLSSPLSCIHVVPTCLLKQPLVDLANPEAAGTSRLT
jgi:hypothetical protein